MNILIVSAVFPPEPVVSAKLSKEIAEELSKQHKVVVISPKPTRPLGFDFEKNLDMNLSFEHIVLDTFTHPESKMIGRFRESWSMGKASSEYIKQNHAGIDAVYMNSWPVFGQLFVVSMTKKFKIPIFTHVQDVYPEVALSKINGTLAFLMNLLFLPIDKYILKNSSVVIAIAEKMKSYLVETRKLDENKVVVVSNWQNEEEFIKYHETAAGKKKLKKPFTFMYLGNIGPIAGVELLIKSFADANIKNANLVIAGSGSKKDELREVVSANKYQNIYFQEVPNGAVPRIQDQADVLILPIKKGAASSSVPSKLPAYMFSKKPIIAAVDETSETARVVQQASCGWVIPPENDKELSRNMIMAYQAEKAELERMGNEGFQYALKYLSKEGNLPLITSLISSKH